MFGLKNPFRSGSEGGSAPERRESKESMARRVAKRFGELMLAAGIMIGVSNSAEAKQKPDTSTYAEQMRERMGDLSAYAPSEESPPIATYHAGKPREVVKLNIPESPSINPGMTAEELKSALRESTLPSPEPMSDDEKINIAVQQGSTRYIESAATGAQTITADSIGRMSDDEKRARIVGTDDGVVPETQVASYETHGHDVRDILILQLGIIQNAARGAQTGKELGADEMAILIEEMKKDSSLNAKEPSVASYSTGSRGADKRKPVIADSFEVTPDETKDAKISLEMTDLLEGTKDALLALENIKTGSLLNDEQIKALGETDVSYSENPSNKITYSEGTKREVKDLRKLMESLFGSNEKLPTNVQDLLSNLDTNLKKLTAKDDLKKFRQGIETLRDSSDTPDPLKIDLGLLLNSARVVTLNQSPRALEMFAQRLEKVAPHIDLGTPINFAGEVYLELKDVGLEKDAEIKAKALQQQKATELSQREAKLLEMRRKLGLPLNPNRPKYTPKKTAGTNPPTVTQR